MVPNSKNYTSDNRSSLLVSRESGILARSLCMSEQEIADYWPNSIFSVQSLDNYTALRPFAIARLNYVVDASLKMEKLADIDIASICDFATGQSILPGILQRLGNFSITVTKSLKNLVKRVAEKGYQTNKLTFSSDPSDLQLTQVDAGFLTWTLCKYRNPLAAVKTAATNIKAGGLLFIADSSSIMVPFEKTLTDLISQSHTPYIHRNFSPLKLLLEYQN